MDWAQRGIYTWLIGICWLQKTIPSDIGSLARITRLDIAWWEQNGAIILKCFKPSSSGLLIHPRIEKERSRMMAYKEKKSASGVIGAEKRWYKHKKTKEINASAIRLPLANDSISISNSISNSIKDKSIEATPRAKDLIFEKWREEFLEHRHMDYRHTKGDFVQLAGLKKALGLNGSIPKDFEVTVHNYFGSKLGKFTLADFCSRYDVFMQGPLDKYGKPAELFEVL
jgi:uncharacterized protein YdaU (DUF1376 family)